MRCASYAPVRGEHLSEGESAALDRTASSPRQGAALDRTSGSPRQGASLDRAADSGESAALDGASGSPGQGEVGVDELHVVGWWVEKSVTWEAMLVC